MIRFPCRCGATLEVPDDQAGLPVQCSRCGLLVDAPGVGDLGALEADGSYKMEAPKVKPNPDALAEMQRAFSPEKHDAFGNEVDLRGAAGQGVPGLYTAGADELGLAPGPSDPFQPPPERPRYDPETGELLETIDVTPPAQPPAPQKIPVAMALTGGAQAPVARGHASIISTPSPHGAGILLELFKPVNLLVIILYAVALSISLALLMLVAGFFLAAAAFAGPAGIPSAGMRIILPLLALSLMALLGSHLANVIEDTGPAEADELPRLLRDLSFFEDLWNPALRVAVAAFLAYGPWFAWLVFCQTALGTKLPGLTAGAGYWVFYLLGALVFPALMLTSCTSGNLANLRPDRVFAVIGKSGALYWLALLLWVLTTLLPTGAAFLAGHLPPLFAWAVLLGSLPLVASYLLHAMGWVLGSIHRHHWPDFPWVFQRHIPAAPRAFQVLPQRRPPAQPPPPPPREVR